jgi:hypothetical protein
MASAIVFGEPYSIGEVVEVVAYDVPLPAR